MTVCHASEGSGRLVQTYIFANHDLDQTVKSTLRKVEVEGADLLQHCLLPHTKQTKVVLSGGSPCRLMQLYCAHRMRGAYSERLCVMDQWKAVLEAVRLSTGQPIFITVHNRAHFCPEVDGDVPAAAVGEK